MSAIHKKQKGQPVFMANEIGSLSSERISPESILEIYGKKILLHIYFCTHFCPQGSFYYVCGRKISCLIAILYNFLSLQTLTLIPGLNILPLQNREINGLVFLFFNFSKSKSICFPIGRKKFTTLVKKLDSHVHTSPF